MLKKQTECIMAQQGRFTASASLGRRLGCGVMASLFLGAMICQAAGDNGK